MIDIFIGYDEREALAYHVCCDSIIQHASCPVNFHPLSLNMFPEYVEDHDDGSNSFIYTRFLVPYLMGFKGQALFIDGDMVVRGDILDIFEDDYQHAVSVVKHDYKTKYPVKYLGNKNEDYPRKNWSSVMLFNCSNPFNKVLTPDFIRSKSGAYLHRFSWLPDDLIGELGSTWNRLVLEQEVQDEDVLLHYTIGTPCFDEYKDCTDSIYWHEAKDKALRPWNTAN
jgi:hypothetical protein